MNETAVSNTGPPLHLAEIGQERLLSLFGRVIVSEQIQVELRRHGVFDRVAATLDDRFARGAWFKNSLKRVTQDRRLPSSGFLPVARRGRRQEDSGGLFEELESQQIEPVRMSSPCQDFSRTATFSFWILTAQESEMKMDTLVPPARRWTAAELRKLPPDQRDAIMEAAAALAEEEYSNNAELTAFEAFGKDDLHGDSSSTETR